MLNEVSLLLSGQAKLDVPRRPLGLDRDRLLDAADRECGGSRRDGRCAEAEAAVGAGPGRERLAAGQQRHDLARPGSSPVVDGYAVDPDGATGDALECEGPEDRVVIEGHG